MVQFDTTKNRFLAAGDEFAIKYWDMDNVNLLTTCDADGGLPVTADFELFYIPVLENHFVRHNSVPFIHFVGITLH